MIEIILQVENEVVAVTEQLNEAERHNLALSNDCKKLKSQVDELLQVKQVRLCDNYLAVFVLP